LSAAPLSQKAPSAPLANFFHSGFFALEIKTTQWLHDRVELNLNSGAPMKKLVCALLATVLAFSVAGCAGGMGKGKAPPVVTKG
jgi:hypothetical protein